VAELHVEEARAEAFLVEQLEGAQAVGRLGAYGRRFLSTAMRVVLRMPGSSFDNENAHGRECVSRRAQANAKQQGRGCLEDNPARSSFN